MARECAWDSSSSANATGAYGWDEVIDPAIKQEEFGDNLFSYLCQLKHEKILCASHATIIAYWASGAGAKSEILALLAFRPDDPSTGHYSRHFDIAVGAKMDRESFYHLQSPMENRLDASRGLENIPVYNFFEELEAEIEENKDLCAQFDKAMATRGSLPPIYWNHPVVVANPGRRVWPCAIYIDGLAVTRTDGLLAFYFYNLISGKRCLCCSLRKTEMCKCGCGGWDSLYPVWLWISWQVETLKQGRRPKHRHDELVPDWGEESGILGAFIFLKADLQEFGTSFGLPGVQSNYHMCPICDCSKFEILNVAGYSPVSSPHKLMDHDDYEEACQRCEHKVTITLTRDLSLLKATLDYDKRPDGSRGRRLREDLTIGTPPVSLRLNDRVEPTPEMPYVLLLDKAPLPLTLVFWRRSAETRARRRNPFFKREHGTTLDRCMVFDWLHTLSLGTIQDTLKYFMHQLFLVDAWGTNQSTYVSKVGMSTSIIQAELFQWYGEEAKHGHIYTRVQTLAATMFGEAMNNPGFSLHGGEANGFLNFAFMVVLPAHRHKLDYNIAMNFDRCLTSLLFIIDTIKLYKTTFPPEVSQD